MDKTTFAATGRRKAAVARVILTEGKGDFQVNGRQITEYLLRDTLVTHAREPLAVADAVNRFDIRCTAKGGGVSGQAGAIRLALARALVLMSPDLRVDMRRHGMITRDAREVERKKYGQPKARKRFQFSKR